MNRKTYFSYYWYFYLIIIVLVISLWSAIFYIDSLPPKNKTINLFICSNRVNTLDLSSYLTKCYENNDNYEYVSIDYISPDNSYNTSIFQTRGLVSSDCMLLPYNYLNPAAYSRYFKELDKTMLDNKYGIQEYLSYENKNYGIKIPQDAFCSQYIDLSDQYYLFILNREIKDDIYDLIDYLVKEHV